MALRDPDKDFIKVNKALGKVPSIGPIPANQLVPWACIFFLSWIVMQELLGLGLFAFFALSFWLIVSFWLLTGNRSYDFTDRLKNPPGSDWTVGYRSYRSLLQPTKQPRPQRR
ncbi:MAG: hypothetical protein NW224_12665 [Leptolyngbyaceae cyanobacterium bins.302]|nr:hypothetical protein [Leptolyngbyaceae cyanobacterium bins.302]